MQCLDETTLTPRATAATRLASFAAELGLPGGSPRHAGERYFDAIRRIWHLGDGAGLAPSQLQQELVRYATRAPSSHNTRCWRFAIEPNRISIVPDLTRRLPRR